VIEALLGDLSLEQFLDRHYTRLPHSGVGSVRGITSFSGWPALETILRLPGIDAFSALEGRRGEGTPSRARYDEGYTLVVRSAERHDAELARLAEGFRADFQAPVNVHVYATPAGRSGFGWHYDPEDVFILQIQGAKEYRLRKNTVNPWPLLEQMPKDLRFEREITPTLSCLLRPGDWLYLPTGWWHEARGADGDSITIAVGLMTPAAIDLLDFVRRELLNALPWRQRLPLKPEDLATILNGLRKDLERVLADEGLIERYVSFRRTR
jgi:ribosomal protein L16 Arg81 hydroxylase